MKKNTYHNLLAQIVLDIMLNMNKDYIVQFSQTNKNSGINGLNSKRKKTIEIEAFPHYTRARRK